jgi:hypothetical protein
MGRASVRTSANPTSDSFSGFHVTDVVEIDPAYGLGASGVVLVLEDFRPSDPDAMVGHAVDIRLPGGWTLSGEIAGVRDHGPTASILLSGWPDGFPRPQVGWRVEIPALDPSPA